MRLHGTQTLGRMTFQFTQHMCDGCEATHPETTQGHERGIVNPPKGWKMAIASGTLRTFCPRCQHGTAQPLF